MTEPGRDANGGRDENLVELPAMQAFRLYTTSTLALSMAALIVCWRPTPARADLVIAIQPSSAPTGGVGSFDVDLSNIGGSTSYDVSAFSVELSVPGASGIAFTSATVYTAAGYIFGTLQSSSLVPDPLPPNDFIASDASMTSPYVTTLNVGDTFGLEHVTYSVAAGAPLGPVTVSVLGIGTTTEILDINGDTLPSTQPNSVITIVPEPSSGLLLSSAMLAVYLTVFARRARTVSKQNVAPGLSRP